MNKHIGSELFREFESLFPVLTVEGLIEEFQRNNIYKTCAISPFDHILSDFEAKESIISYSGDLTPSDKVRFDEIEQNYLEAYKKIYEENAIYLFKEELSGNHFLTLGKDEFIKACLLNIREKELFLLVIPERRLLIQGDYDHGANCYSLDRAGLEYVKRIFINSGFHILCDNG